MCCPLPPRPWSPRKSQTYTRAPPVHCCIVPYIPAEYVYIIHIRSYYVCIPFFPSFLHLGPRPPLHCCTTLIYYNTITNLIRIHLDNIYVTTKQYTMSNKLKLTQTKILKLNNQTYLPFLIHNLPNNYNKFPLNSIIKIKSTIYINTNNFNKKYINNYTSTLNYSNINKNNIK